MIDRTVAAVVLDWAGGLQPRTRDQTRRLRRRVEALTRLGVHVVLLVPATSDRGATPPVAAAVVGATAPVADPAPEVSAVSTAADQLRELDEVIQPGPGHLLLSGPGGTDPRDLVPPAQIVAAGDRRPVRPRSVLLSTWLDDRGIGPGLVLVVARRAVRAEVADSARWDRAWQQHLLGDGYQRAAWVDPGVIPGEAPAPGPAGAPARDTSAVVRLLDEQLTRRRRGRVLSIDVDPRWTLHETGTDPMRHRVTETLLTIGAGGIATRGSTEDPTPGSAPLVLAGGVYDGTGPDTHLLPGPSWTHIEVDPRPAEDIRVLDLRTGIVVRDELSRTGPGMRSLRFGSVASPGLFVLRAESAPGRMRTVPVLEPPHGGAMDEGGLDGVRWGRTDGSGGGIGTVVRQSRRSADGVATLERLASYVASDRRRPSLGPATERLEQARRTGVDLLVAEQRELWARRWDAVGIWLPDDPRAELALRFALFQLWSNTADGDELAVGARGLSGPAYSGHVFWDADVYVLPALLTMHPPAAAAMVRYRLRRLEAARRLARAGGRHGARFPWESAGTGEDVTPSMARVGGTDLPIWTGAREEHITADVAWGAVRCARWTGEEPARSAAYPILVETARYWASRCEVDPDGTVHLRGVMGPDEYHARVDDNAFTNVMVRWNLREAANAADRRREPGEETRRWRSLADHLVDGYDPATGRYEQFAGYDGLEPMLASDVAPPPVAADLVLGRARVESSQILKQADVLMLHHMVPDEVATGSLVPNLDHYGPRTAHGSSLSPAVTASLLARADRLEEALEMLHLALDLDLEDLTGTTAAGLHLATLAGSWLAVVQGFLGVRLVRGTVALDPHLPPEWHRMEVRFRALGIRIRVRVHWPRMTVTTDGPLRVRIGGHPELVVDREAEVDISDLQNGEDHG